MMRAFFDRELDNVATFWRLYRRDGVALAFTSHDRDLAFGGMRHRAAPGMVPSSIKLTTEISADSAEVEGVLNHAAISEADLASGLFDQAAIEIGAVDWESLDHRILYSGQIGQVETGQNSFSAELRSAKRILDLDLVPRTSPTCRANFCGPGCNLSPLHFVSNWALVSVDYDANRVSFGDLNAVDYLDGQVRFLEGPQTGMTFGIIAADAGGLVLDRQLTQGLAPGMRAQLREGCDHTLTTCSTRFGNAINFRGEPFLPGNDLLTRYGQPSG